jgi:D-serine deaminase-like pyridoxal phosphate-dependent protein
MQLDDILTPALVLDLGRMTRNIDRMRSRVARLGVAFRPHVKTAKSIEVCRRLTASPGGPITVSTLHEAERFFAHGVTDILYAVGISPDKLPHVADLRARGCDLSVVLDSREAARAVSAFCRARGSRIPVLVEIDCDGHRSGVRPDDPGLADLAAEVGAGAALGGVMTHAGGAYTCASVRVLAAAAEQERAAVVDAASRLRAAGFSVPIVSVGSTPTATFAADLSGVTELRAGVFVFQDLFQAGLGVCAVGDIALSVLVSVIGWQRDKGWIITDGGWMALSGDRGTMRQATDRGLGLVLDADGRLLDGFLVSGANQEHGVVSRPDGAPVDWSRFPLGAHLRVLPNHACATAAQHAAYHVVDGSGEVVGRWERFGGWE